MKFVKDPKTGDRYGYGSSSGVTYKRRFGIGKKRAVKQGHFYKFAH